LRFPRSFLPVAKSHCDNLSVIVRIIVGWDGRFIGVQEIEAPDDKAALRKAKQYAGERDVEVWQRERRVGRIASADPNPVVELALRQLAQKVEKTRS
jgi:hypothetical protein